MTNFATFLATHPWVIILAAIWTIPWKGVALWRAARKESTAWFVVLLIVNTLGILEIIYIFAFSKKEKEEEPQPIEPQEIPKPEKKVLDIKGEEKKEEKKPSLDEETPKS
jgi:methionyl-tRNA synthetase